MFLTPEEAKKVWCPMYRGSAYHRYETYGCNCISKECSMWRWSWSDPNHFDFHSSVGYCGLARRPYATGDDK